MLGWQAYTYLSMLACSLGGDIQNIEGLNNIIKLISSRCNFISLALLSGRVCLKYKIGVFNRFQTKSRSFAAIAPIAKEMHVQLSGAYRGAMEVVLADENRWASAPALLDVATDAELFAARVFFDPANVVTPALTWATKFSALFHRKFADASVQRVFSFERLSAAGVDGFVIADKDGRVSWMAVGRLRKEGDIYKFRLARPSSYQKFGFLVSTFYTELALNPEARREVHQYELEWKDWRETGDALVRTDGDNQVVFALTTGRMGGPAPAPDDGAHRGGRRGGRGRGRPPGRARGRGRGRVADLDPDGGPPPPAPIEDPFDLEGALEEVLAADPHIGDDDLVEVIEGLSDRAWLDLASVEAGLHTEVKDENVGDDEESNVQAAEEARLLEELDKSGGLKEGEVLAEAKKFSGAAYQDMNEEEILDEARLSLLRKAGMEAGLDLLCMSQ